jgi:hypothetical protein
MSMKNRVRCFDGVDDTLGGQIPDVDIVVSTSRYQLMASIAYW